MGSERKVILIGLDGATWNIIQPLVEKNELPAFQQLLRQGVYADFKSTIPSMSPPAWNSIYTGVSPAKHSIYSFVRRTRNSYFYQPISARDRTMVPLWQHLSDHGKKVIALNLPFSYPPDRVNGILTTGLGTPSRNADFVYPPDYRNSLLSKFPDFDVDFNEDLVVLTRDVSRFLDQIEAVTAAQIEMAKYLMHHEEWDFFFCVFRATDVIQHYFWDNQELVHDYYKRFDDLLAYLLNQMDDNHTLMVCSDHGFDRVHTYVYVSNLLQEIGLLRIKPRRIPKIVDAELIQALMLKLGLRRLVWQLKRGPLIERVLKYIPSSTFSYLFRVDWSATRAFYYETSAGLICINLLGREPQGCVSAAEYNQTRELIIGQLLSFKDPVTKQNIIKKAFTREELYGGECESAPDIILLKNEGFHLIGYSEKGDIFQEPVGATKPIAQHTENGIFLATGADIKGGGRVTAGVCDIAPTIYHILGTPIPTSVDGKVLDIFEPASELDREPVYQSSVREKLRSKIKRIRP